MSHVLGNFLSSTGFAALTWQAVLMLVISVVLIYLAIDKGFEPLLLLPIGFGMLLTNLPLAGLMEAGVDKLTIIDSDKASGVISVVNELQQPGGLLGYFFKGDELGIFPPLIFMGVGAMTDFGPLIADPKSLILGAAAQFGIFFTFMGAILLGFNGQEASSIAIIGGADGPTSIYLTGQLAPHMLGQVAVAAYSYMALVPIIQPPIMKALTTKNERVIKMPQMRKVSKKEKIIFPILVTLLVSLTLPDAAPLIGMLMFGNLMKESLVVERLSKTAQNELMNIITILLGLSVGASASADQFLNVATLKILLLGLFAFAVGTATGVLMAKLMNLFLKDENKINPLIGSAGVSAVPMAARVSNVVGQEADPNNFLLMNAMGPNVSGVIGSAVAAGVLLTLFG
ncbi:MAG: sodium ion-translocating decarboxylase subunit beta [Anaerococcus sp.]|nr:MULTISPECIES: sodium ion-translocating decarboxylase subunit beta [Anaerococcus]MBP2069275.1 oxaloacetate decarboxylase beta subunit [Anaerococcus nagyae]MDU1828009.1 sodium ion-translocating decarboxylase subunit beta [Anaerococcus sp.]MDU1864568.1 sodium ion-translocating decarboxylase subunit beta [Anaerococcus sp.]MDU2353074.1 sodium ion-translocating decarboxylase subunit beta [Anaerococcus sp.]MDU3210793.1 sodium ion-translocating decarboxylase subunit beta [Anaerococcus sp.]